MDYEAGIIEVVSGVAFLTIAPLATLTGMNALEMDSEGRIVEVALDTEFLTMTDERAIIKLGLKIGAGSSHGKSVQAIILFVILHSVYASPDRLATASERTSSHLKIEHTTQIQTIYCCDSFQLHLYHKFNCINICPFSATFSIYVSSNGRSS